MSENGGLIGAYTLDGDGGGQSLDWAGIRAWKPESGPLWVHLDRKDEEAQSWLEEEAGLNEVVSEALLADDPRPRMQMIGSGAVVILRGVNLNPGAEPDDMISVRMWVEADRIISLRSPKLMAIQDVRDELARGEGPCTSGQVLVAIAVHMGERIAPVIANLDELIDESEEQVVDAPGHELRRELGHIRRQAISLRRYIAPQRDAIAGMAGAITPWLSDLDRMRLRELQDRTTRYVEDLDALRERAAVVQEELSGRLAEQMNRTMYVLSLVAGIFLPLGLLTGLLGINVGGMPGVEDDMAFWIVCAVLVALAILGVWLFRRMRLF